MLSAEVIHAGTRITRNTMLFEAEWIVQVDGASRGNPGDASYGFAVLNTKGEVLHQESDYIGRTTNNVAEYTALIKALEYALRNRILSIEIRSDSELLVKQFLGEYKVKSEHLAVLHEKCRELLRQLQWYEFKHVPREQNRLADRLANEALDRRKKQEAGDGTNSL